MKLRRQTNYGAQLTRLLLLIFVAALGAFLLYKGLLFYGARRLLPVGVTVAGLDVSGLSREEAAELIDSTFVAPLVVIHGDEQVEIQPTEIGLTVDTGAMLDEIDQRRAKTPWWLAFGSYLIDRSLDEIELPLLASYDRPALQARLESIAGYLDQPARQPQPVGDTLEFQEGSHGFVTDISGSMAGADKALFSPDQRRLELQFKPDQAPLMNMEMLGAAVESATSSFDGLGSFFVINLDTGEELAINADVALSGLSIVKVAILLEAYRVIDNESGPTLDQSKLISETAILSGNFSANLLLDVVAGQDNAYLGSDILTESMHRLGLVNTFIAVPYEEPPRPGKETYSTPANQRTDINTQPDQAMQTTAEEIGSLLAMLYYCSQGGGPILALYPSELTPAECREILDYLELNVEGNLIRFGVPDDVPVSHKHGWAGGTHGDAGVVFSPGANYVIVEYLHQDGGWLVSDISFPLLRQVSRIVYNYFNREAPYEGRNVISSE